jgi:hypothetical protein
VTIGDPIPEEQLNKLLTDKKLLVAEVLQGKYSALRANKEIYLAEVKRDIANCCTPIWVISRWKCRTIM